MLLLKIGGEQWFSGVEATDEEFVVAIVLIHRLWSRISFEEFRIEVHSARFGRFSCPCRLIIWNLQLSDHDDPSDYVKWSVEKFEIKLFQFRVSYEPQLHRWGLLIYKNSSSFQYSANHLGSSFKPIHDDCLQRYFSATETLLNLVWENKIQ